MKTEHWETFWKDSDNHDWWEKPAEEVLVFLNTQSPKLRPKVLDLGCGIGRHAIAFAEVGYDVFASDDSQTAINQLNAKASDLSCSIETRVSDFSEDCFPGQSFDIVLSYNVIYHGFKEQFAQTIDLVFQKLNPGGIFFFTCPNRKDGKYGFGQEVAPHTFLCEKSVTPGHIHYFADKEDLENMLNKFSSFNTQSFSGNWNNKGIEQYYSYWAVIAEV